MPIETQHVTRIVFALFMHKRRFGELHVLNYLKNIRVIIVTITMGKRSANGRISAIRIHVRRLMLCRTLKEGYAI